MYNQLQFISMNPSNTMQMVNDLSRSMSTEPPSSIYIRRQPEKWENMINQRIGLVNLKEPKYNIMIILMIILVNKCKYF